MKIFAKKPYTRFLQVARHPAKYSDSLLPHFLEFLKDKKEVLDLFAGTGKLKNVCPNATLLEIEPEWAEINGAIIGDATNMPLKWSEKFDAVCTSPCYGNRMADSFNAKDKSKRNTYHHSLGRKPSSLSSATLQWGDKYRDFHVKAWQEVHRVLKSGGMFILNISDHIRNGKIIQVSEWHRSTIESLGFILIEHRKVSTPRNTFGANRKRVNFESIFVFRKEVKPNSSHD